VLVVVAMSTEILDVLLTVNDALKRDGKPTIDGSVRIPCPHLHRDWGSRLPHLRWDWGHPTHILRSTAGACTPARSHTCMRATPWCNRRARVAAGFSAEPHRAAGLEWSRQVFSVSLLVFVCSVGLVIALPASFFLVNYPPRLMQYVALPLATGRYHAGPALPSAPCTVALSTPPRPTHAAQRSVPWCRRGKKPSSAKDLWLNAVQENIQVTPRTAAASLPGLGSPCRICIGTGLNPPASAPGPGSPSSCVPRTRILHAARRTHSGR
jgi:hypothetical protein